MTDYAHVETDKIIESTERKMMHAYQKAAKEVNDKLEDYLKRFEKKDKTWRDWVRRGVKTREEYKRWRYGQMIAGRRWAALIDNLARKFHIANIKATEISMGARSRVYELNFNYSTYQIEQAVGFDTGFVIYDAATVERLFTDDPDLLPPPGKRVSRRIAEGKDILWNRQQIQSVAIQSIVQGESIHKMAKRLAEEVGDKNYKAAVRNARTMATGAENAGRVDSYKRAESIGIRLSQKWIASLDMRTRHEHRMLDGQVADVGKPFTVDGYKIMFPGDPAAPPHLIYNCRCTLIGMIKGHEIDSTKYRRDPMIEGMTYEQWKQDRRSRSNPIDLPYRKSAAIKASYIREYRTK